MVKSLFQILKSNFLGVTFDGISGHYGMPCCRIEVDCHGTSVNPNQINNGGCKYEGIKKDYGTLVHFMENEHIIIQKDSQRLYGVKILTFFV